MPDAPKRIEICPFPGGKRVAITTSWDDGRVYDRRIVAAFNEWGLKGTFNLSSSFLTRTGKPAPADSTGNIDVCEVASLYAGHEVAVHGLTHPWLARLDQTQIAHEILEDRKALEDLVGYPVRGMAYPFGNYDDRVIAVLRQCGIVYSRTVENRDPCFPPAEPLAWPATMHMYNSQPTPLPQRFEEWYTRGWSAGQVFFVWGHSYEFADRKDWDSLPKLFAPMAGKSDAWYCTNIELFDYEAARKRVVIAANRRSAHNPSGVTVTLSVDGKLVDVAGGKTVGL